jgi:hypothetical protein
VLNPPDTLSYELRQIVVRALTFNVRLVWHDPPPDGSRCAHPGLFRGACDMAFFNSDHISLERVEPDGMAVYSVAWTGAPYPGWIRVNARRHQSDATEEWIADALNRQVTRFGLDVVEAGLARPLLLE